MLFFNEEAKSPQELFYNKELKLEQLSEKINNIFKVKTKDKYIDYILKVYQDQKLAQTEYKMLSKLKNIPKIPQILESGFKTEFSFILMTKFPGLDLFEYTQTSGYFSEWELKPIIKQILEILRDIHKEGIIHQDIKPENIVYSEDTKEAFLVDFEHKQTRLYQSPEQMKNSTNITSKTDIFSLGLCIPMLLHGENLKYNGKTENYKIPINCSPELQDFLICILDPIPTHRYSAEEALNHEWLDNCLE